MRHSCLDSDRCSSTSSTQYTCREHPALALTAENTCLFKETALIKCDLLRFLVLDQSGIMCSFEMVAAHMPTSLTTLLVSAKGSASNKVFLHTSALGTVS